MAKRAVLKMEVKNEKGQLKRILLTLHEKASGFRGQQTTWEWYLPSHFGWGTNDLGVFSKDMTDTSMVFCMNKKDDDAIIISGIVPRTLFEFPFTPADYKNKIAGELEVLKDNYYMKSGTYNWSVWYVSI